MGIISLNLYKNLNLFFLVSFIDIILRNVGNKYKGNGYIKLVRKLIPESFIKVI